MGSNTISVETASVIQKTHVNKFQTALAGDILARNTSGVPTDESGNLGSAAIQFLRAYVKTGAWVVGDTKTHHSYNGLCPPGEGWMLCNGNIVNQANYDSEHGAGHWATYIGTSPLNGKYLPNMDSRYVCYRNATAQDGTVAITQVGNALNAINLQHTHVTPSHTHGFAHDHGIAAGTDFGGVGTGKAYLTTAASTSTTDGTSPTINNSLSASQSIAPDSIEFQLYMRII